MYEEVIWRSNWQPCQFNQSSDISSSSDSVVSSSCCIFSSGTSSASSFSASSCFSSSCYFQLHVYGSLNGSQIFTEHVSKSLCRTRDPGSIQQVASNATIRKKSYGGHPQTPNQSGLTLLHHVHLLEPEQGHYIVTFALPSQKRSEKHRKAMFCHSSLFNPCPRREHALGQRPVINRFTSGCWKDTACISKYLAYPGMIMMRMSKHLVVDHHVLTKTAVFNITNPYQMTSWNQLGKVSATGNHIGRLININRLD